MGLETVEQQMAFLVESGLMEPEIMLKSFEEFDVVKSILKEMIESYQREEISKLFGFIANPNEYSSEKETEKMVATLLTKRNKNWVQMIPGIAKNQ